MIISRSIHVAAKATMNYIFFIGLLFPLLKLILWPPHVKNWLVGKDSDAGRDWGQEEKGRTEDEMAGWHHWLDGHEFEWTPGDGDGHGGLASWDSWGRKESDTTEWLNWTFPLYCKCHMSLFIFLCLISQRLKMIF